MLRGGEPGTGPLLPRLRRAARRGACKTGTQARLRALRRPGRLHAQVGPRRSRGCTGHAAGLSERRPRRIDHFGGTMEKFIGDAVMAVFGAPVSHGDDAERAVRAGLAILDAVAALKLEARAAVNSGEAGVTGTSGSPTGGAPAMGDVVNTASRLQTTAGAGTLVVGEETYRLTRSAITYRPVSAVEAKGEEAPLRAWLTIAAGSVARPPPDIEMVGRAHGPRPLPSRSEGATRARTPPPPTL